MHVMVIPDGDRRYARREGIPLIQAYQQAAVTVRNLVKWLLVDCGVDTFTFFGLSYANIKRRKAVDLKPILDVQAKTLEDFSKDRLFHDHSIKVRVHGRTSLLPERYQKAIRRIESVTKHYGPKEFHMLLGYSGSHDFLQAVRKTVRSGQAVTWANIIRHCSISTPVDFLIRTASEKRLSDGPFFLMPYTEFAFIPSFFPELSRKDIKQALEDYENRKRTFGI